MSNKICSTCSELCLSLNLWRVGKNDFPCFLGERCEDRGRAYQESCANQCPRSCTDLWEHVQCLQGACHAGNLWPWPKQQIILTKRLIPRSLNMICWSIFLCLLFSFIIFLPYFPFLFSQVVGVQRDSCCRTATVCQWRSVAVGSHLAMGH